MSRRIMLLLASLSIVVVVAAAVSLTGPDDNMKHSPSQSVSVPITTSPTPPMPAPAVPAAENAARQGLAVAYTWYPRADSGPRDGFGRATRWLSPALAERVQLSTPLARGPGIAWDQWKADGDKIIADVIIGCSGCPPDTDTAVHRVATIRQTAVNHDHAVPVDPDTVVWVTMTKSAGGWLIDTIQW
ncbi:hypothetical protein [Nocardia nova]|uniref:hypothetical protein n=1 Tax=Nocardia nova TaxID=37330 RepID=UPI0033EC49B9